MARQAPPDRPRTPRSGRGKPVVWRPRQSLKLLLTPAAQAERGPEHLVSALAAIHAALGPRDALTLSYELTNGGVRLACAAEGQLARLAERQFSAVYPDLHIERSTNSFSPVAFSVGAPSTVTRCRALRLAPDVLPLALAEQQHLKNATEKNDPVANLLCVLATGGAAGWPAAVTLVARLASPARQRQALAVLDQYFGTRLANQRRRGAWFLQGATSRWAGVRIVVWFVARLVYARRVVSHPLPSAYPKLAGPLFEVELLLTAAAPTQRAAERRLEQLESALAPFLLGSELRIVRRNGRGSLLSVAELALLWHPPTQTVQTERLERLGTRELEPPPRLTSATEPDAVLLGRIKFRRRDESVMLRADDRLRHLYLCGKTGTGKSTLLLNLAADDAARGRGLGVIDPHGDLATELAARIPRSRTNDLVLCDPATRPLAFNPLECRDPARRPLVAAGVLTALQKIFGVDETTAPRMLYILRNVLFTLVGQPNSTLLDIPRILVDAAFRRALVARLADDSLREFWRSEFEVWNDRYRTEAIAPIQNKVGQYLTSPILRAMFASPRSELDFRRMMDRGQIFVANLSVGRLGEDSARLLGALLVTAAQQAAMTRAELPAAERKPFYLYADEFQTYAGTESLEIILSQARKYGLALTLSNQLVGQMSPSLAQTVFGNVGSLVAFQLGREDAERLATELGGAATAGDLIAIPKYTAIVRLLMAGEPTRPFTIRTLPPPPVTARHARPERLAKSSGRQRRPNSRSHSK